MLRVLGEGRSFCRVAVYFYLNRIGVAVLAYGDDVLLCV